jgi:hypothetical protein
MAKATIYYFNPTCELAVANGSFSYMPPLLLQEMESHLSVLPFIFASENDFVLTENPPSDGFIRRLKDAGFDTPRFCSLNELEALPDGSIKDISPWGWSPATHFKLKNLKEKCTDEFKASPVFHWKSEHQLLFERSTSLNFLADILANNSLDWFIEQSLTGTKVTSTEEIEMLLKRHIPLVIKAPLSSSGRGIQIIRRKNLSSSNRQWISGVLKQQNYLVAEPFLKKLADLSFQFLVKDNFEIDYLGYSFFETNSNGQYNGTLIHPELETILSAEHFAVFKEKISETVHVLTEALKKSVYVKYHRGYLGVDSLLFLDRNQLYIQPCIEVNCRMNMGIVSLLLEKKIQRDSIGKFGLWYANSGKFVDFSNEQSSRNRLKILNGKVCSGFFSLVEEDPYKKFGAYFSLLPK